MILHLGKHFGMIQLTFRFQNLKREVNTLKTLKLPP